MMPKETPSSDEHIAVTDFKAKSEEIRNVTIPAATEARKRAEEAMGCKPPESAQSPGESLAGSYTITVAGSGPHHNMRRTDAERLLARFVRELRANGHTVEHASFKNGNEEPMHDDPEALASADETKEVPSP